MILTAYTDHDGEIIFTPFMSTQVRVIKVKVKVNTGATSQTGIQPGTQTMEHVGFLKHTLQPVTKLEDFLRYFKLILKFVIFIV